MIANMRMIEDVINSMSRSDVGVNMSSRLFVPVREFTLDIKGHTYVFKPTIVYTLKDVIYSHSIIYLLFKEVAEAYKDTPILSREVYIAASLFIPLFINYDTLDKNYYGSTNGN